MGFQSAPTRHVYPRETQSRWITLGENELYVSGRTCPCGHPNPVPRRQPAQTTWPPSWLARQDAPCVEGDALEVAEELGRVKIHCHSRASGGRRPMQKQ